MNENTKPTLKLISPMPVSVNHYIKPRTFIVNGKAQVSMYETADAKKYKKDFIKHIIEEARKQNWNWIPNKTQHFYIDSYFYFPRIDMDANNHYKIMLDAITEPQIVWIDDNVALERVQRILYDSKNPRIELTIYPVDYIGIFNNEEELTLFKDTYCDNCSRSKKNCSILNKAIEGRIQEEIKREELELKCNKFKQNK